jgi:outer membrane biosynthesis protein TonB
MRIPIAAIVAAMLCAVAVVEAQTAPQDAAQPVSATAASDLLKAQTPLGGVEILSDTEGVDLKPFLQQWRRNTDATWQRLGPKQGSAPDQQPGTVAIRFKILPGGQLMDGVVVLEKLSGQEPLDKAVWQTIASSVYPPLPSEFHGPYLELRAYFNLNQQQAK